MTESKRHTRLIRPVSGGQPVEPQRGPSPRHFIQSVRQSTFVRDWKTVIEPWVGIDADIEAILSGRAIRRGDRFVVNDRHWGIEANGTLFPIVGPGFIRLDCESYRVLGVYNAFGDTPEAAAILDRMHNQTSTSRGNGFRAWRAGRQGE